MGHLEHMGALAAELLLVHHDGPFELAGVTPANAHNRVLLFGDTAFDVYNVRTLS